MKDEATSSFGSRPSARTAWLAIQFNATTIGRIALEMSMSGGARNNTALSAIETEKFFGTISPTVTCRNVTTINVAASATIEMTDSGTPIACNGISNK